ncbi:MAG: response regulator [Chitinophagaceae bacterium]|nr:MAG: response regulator [Chitinophagaceae bacterium]
MNKFRILIAENDEDEQDFLKEGFDSSEYFEVVAMAMNAEGLFRILENNSELPDLVLTDLNMEGQNGYDVLRFMNSHPRFANIPVIVYSGSLLESVVTKCISLGAKEVVMKPSSLDGYQKFPAQLYELMIKEA